ncbi:MAG: hypothetical protein HGA87_00495 [Desulfobulbaceae bacterium]|nr:hypothetical protein [Desulfobulbaceae bacterium]
MASTVPQIAFTPTGLVIPPELEILAAAQADINTAFGNTLSPSLETPQGQLASSIAAIIGANNDLFAYFVNQIDPDFSSGSMQDSIGRIYYITRRPATSTLVTCTCSGAEGTVIPINSLVKDVSGNTYKSTTAETIAATGDVDIVFSNIDTGSIAAPSGTVTTIYQSIPGWDSVTNATDGTLGRAVESRAEFEFRRKSSVALNGRGSLGTIYANVFAVPDVTDVYAYENNTNAVQTIGSSSFDVSPHSIYIAVQGGTDAAVAQAMWKSKDIGADYNGDTSVTITDTENYAYPYPTYTVKFQRPVPVAVKIDVSIVDSPVVPVDAVTNIKAAIISADPARIGREVVAGQFFSAVQSVSPYIQILSILVGEVTPTGTSVSIGIDEVATFSASDITVTLV